MRQTVTLIYFKDKTGKIRSLVLSLGVFNLLAAALVLIPVLSISVSLMTYYKGVPALNFLNFLTGPAEKEIVRPLKAEPIPNKTPGNTIVQEKPADVETETAAETSKEPPAKTEPEAAPGSKILVEGVQMSELEDGSGVSIRFNISRTESSSDKLTGFVFILYKVNGEFQTIPENSKIKKGMPAHFEKGENFFIKHKRPFEKLIPSPKSAISEAYIVIYSSKGRLLLKQKVDIR